MRTWVMRILGVLNLLFGAASVYYLARMLFIHWHKWPVSATRGDWALFAFMLGVSIYLTVHLTYCGIKLIRCDDSVLIPACVLYASQIVLFLLEFVLVWLVLPPSMGKITFGLWEVAFSGLDVQVLTGYAPLGFVITLMLILLARRTKISNQDHLITTGEHLAGS